MIYFKFTNINDKKESKTNWFYDSLGSILTLFIPSSNPDFDKEYNDVLIWYIEYDDQKNYANREIGIDDKGKVIIISPYGENLGFWTDEDLLYDDYLKYEPVNVPKEEFEKLWEKYPNEKI